MVPAPVSSAMPSLWVIVGDCGHALAAVLFAALAIIVSRRSSARAAPQILVLALALTAFWSLRQALQGFINGGVLGGGVAETLRNAAWLAFLIAVMVPEAGGWRQLRGRAFIIAALGLLLATQLAFDLFIGEGAPVNLGLLPFFSHYWILRCTFALGALALLHGAFGMSAGGTRLGAWIAAALTFMWAYDFNHYLLSWITSGQAEAIGPMRGFAMALLAPIIAIGLRPESERPLKLSQTVALRLLVGAVLALYIGCAALLATLSLDATERYGQVAQFAVLFVLSVAALALLPSASLRAWLRVELAKHFFAHRYDYRAEWMRFSATVAQGGEDAQPLAERVSRAVAEVTQSPAALIFLAREQGDLACAGGWNWKVDEAPPGLPAALADRLRGGWIVDLGIEHDRADMPGWLRAEREGWALVPAIHRERLVAAVLLARPPLAKPLDWEDLDVLRVVGAQAAATIGEALGRDQLAEAQRFDEFNRRFAFILHDIKNLASQMSLLARNAERHADNPEFREDMVLTLRENATRMTDLLQRLTRPGTAAAGAASGIALRALIQHGLPAWVAGSGGIVVEGDVDEPVRADAEGLSRAIGHLVRNAQEASPADAPVQILLVREGDEARIDIVDQGSGMSAPFIRNELFRPFSSTKSNGFGLGAHEARLLVLGMGGTLEVESMEGRGTRFTLRLPLARMAEPAPATRRRA